MGDGGDEEKKETLTADMLERTHMTCIRAGNRYAFGVSGVGLCVP